MITVSESDKNSIIKYNYVTNQIEDTYYSAAISYDLKDDNYVILVSYVDDNYNRKGGLLSKDGNMLTDFEYYSLPSYKMAYYGVDSKYSNWFGPNSLARVGKNDLYGIIDISSGKVVVELKYQDIILSPNGYYSIKENGKWYLFNTDMKKVLNEGYDGIFGFDFGILVLNKMGENRFSMKLIDYNGEDLTKSIEINNSMFNNYYYGDLYYDGIKYIIQGEIFAFSNGTGGVNGIDTLTLNYDKANKTLSVVQS